MTNLKKSDIIAIFEEDEFPYVVRGLRDLEALFMARVKEASSGALTGDNQSEKARCKAQEELDVVRRILSRLC